MWWGPAEGQLEAARFCHAPTIHHCNHRVIQMEWEICLPESKLCRWEEEMTMDLFPLGHVGVALARIEKNMREEVCLSQYWHDGGYDCCSLLCQDAVDDKVIASEIGHRWSSPLRVGEVHSVGRVVFILFFHWIHWLTTYDMTQEVFLLLGENMACGFSELVQRLLIQSRSFP